MRYSGFLSTAPLGLKGFSVFTTPNSAFGSFNGLTFAFV